MTTEEVSANPTMQPREMVAVLKRINRRSEDNWDDWVKLGIAIVERQAIALRKAGGRTRGEIYAEQLGKAMGQFYADYKRLSDNGTVSALARCVENLDAVTAWRNREAVENRLTSPRRVWETYQESLRSSPIFADMEDDLEKEPTEKWKRRTGNENQQTTNQLLTNKLNELLHAVELGNLTGNARDDADNTWQRVLRMCANDKRLAAAHCRDVMRELEGIIASVLGESVDKDS